MILKSPRLSTLTLFLFIAAQPVISQNKWYDCSRIFVSPDQNYGLKCSSKAGNNGCSVTVLSLMGKGIADSIVVSETSAKTCAQPRFYWSKSAPLLIVETSKGVFGCDGDRITQVYDLEKKEMLHATEGQLYLYDEKRDLVILYNGREERDMQSGDPKFWFNLDAYYVNTNVKLPICSLETYPVTCSDDFELKFDRTKPNMVSIFFLDNQNRMKSSEFKIQY
jgi:hypothetical protein